MKRSPFLNETCNPNAKGKVSKAGLFISAAVALSLLLTSCSRPVKQDQHIKGHDEAHVQSDITTPARQSHGHESTESKKLTAYRVRGNQIVQIRAKSQSWLKNARSLPKTYATQTHHQQLWRRFAELIPASARQNLNEFQIFTDGPTGRDAFVSIDENDYQRFTLGIDAYASLPVKDPSGTLLAQTLVHEFAHMLSLKPGQVIYDPSHQMRNAFRSKEQPRIKAMMSRCGNRLYLIHGCANQGSYLDLFAKQFWRDDLQLWYQNLIFGRMHVQGLFERKPTHFVSLYAASNPGEDFAETWLAFVTGPQIGTPRTVAQQKIKYFERFPELVALKQRIRHVYKARY